MIVTGINDAPEWANEMLHRAGGSNPYGEPMYRLAWGHARLGWKGGLWEDREPKTQRLIRSRFELRLVPKYATKRSRWRLEIWQPNHIYGSPDAWYTSTQVIHPSIPFVSLPGLGPYPSRGEYESFFVIETQDEQFRQIDRPVLEFLCQTVNRHRNSTKEERFLARQREQEAQERESDKSMEDALSPNEPFGLRSSNVTSRQWMDVIREERERNKDLVT